MTNGKMRNNSKRIHDMDPKVARSFERYEKNYRQLAYNALPDNLELETLKWDLSHWTIIMSDLCVNSLVKRKDVCLVEHLNLAGADKMTNAGLGLFVDSMPRLTNLSLENAFQINAGGLVHMVKSCPALRQLNLSGCLGISGTGFAILGQHSCGLVRLALSGCTQVTPWAFMKIFQGCSLLQDLDISFCSLITDQEIRVLADCCKAIEHLNLKECRQISDVGILSLSKGSGILKEVGLFRHDLVTRITDVSLLALAEGCPQLEMIDLSGCEMISDVGVSWLSKGCKHLKTINFTNCAKITNTGMRYLSEGMLSNEITCQEIHCSKLTLRLSECKGIRVVVLKNVKQVSDVGVRYLATSCPRLESINASGMCLLTDGVKRDFGHEGLQSLANEDCSAHIKQLNLHGCFRIFRVALCALSSLKYMESLALSGCKSLSLEGIDAIAKNCKKLSQISLAGCGECVTDAMIEVLGSSLERLKVLDLSDCIKIGKRSCKSLSRCSAMSSLNLSGCRKVCNEAILSLGEGTFRPGLRELFLNRCPKLNDASITWISDSFKDRLTSSGIVTLVTLALKGTKVSLRALKSVEDYFLYSSLKDNSVYFGFLALSRARDRRIINSHAKRSDSIALIQAMVRARMCRLLVEKARLQYRTTQQATRIATVYRGYRARTLMKQHRIERWHRYTAAAKIQSFVRVVLSKNCLNKLKHRRWRNIAPKKAISIQRTFRGYRGRRIAQEAKMTMIRMYHRQEEASVILQCLIRRHLAAKMFKDLEDEADVQERTQLRACIALQTFWRAELARQRINEMRLDLFRHRLRQRKAAKLITALFRQKQFRVCIQKRILHTRSLNDRATIIQGWYRNKLDEARLQEQQQCHRRGLRDKAAVLIQSLARKVLAKQILLRLQIEQNKIEMLKSINTTIITCRCRAHLAKVKVGRLRRQRNEVLKLHFIIETEAATQIGAFWRGCLGRRNAKLKLEQKKSRWKQMWSKEDESYFYYNQLTGESRWRKPQELLDLEPKPLCSNCSFYDAQIECSNCEESFCTVCWEAIHYGGKRKHHMFRTLYDYYNRRIEYDFGDYPSLLPHAVEHDKNGWHLRV